MYRVQHCCGHVQQHDFKGDNKAIFEKIEKESKRLCARCRMYKGNNAALDRRLPLLKGSTKQIAWAESIRDKYIVIYNDLKQNFNFTKDKNKATFAMLKIKNLLETVEDASFWIDNRDNLLNTKVVPVMYRKMRF